MITSNEISSFARADKKQCPIKDLLNQKIINQKEAECIKIYASLWSFYKANVFMYNLNDIFYNIDCKSAYLKSDSFLSNYGESTISSIKGLCAGDMPYFLQSNSYLQSRSCDLKIEVNKIDRQIEKMKNSNYSIVEIDKLVFKKMKIKKKIKILGTSFQESSVSVASRDSFRLAIKGLDRYYNSYFDR